MPRSDALRLASDRRISAATLTLVGFTVVFFLRSDLVLFIQDPTTMALRMGVRFFGLGVIIWAILRLRSEIDRPTYNRVLLVVSLVSAVTLLGLNGMRPQGGVLPLRSPLLWLMALYGGLIAPPRQQILAPLLFSAGLMLLRIFWVTSGAQGDIAGDIVVLLTMNAIGIMFVFERDKLGQSEADALRSETAAREQLEQAITDLKTLRGIIPICSYCKQVRTEVGNWQQIERYVRDHSEAEFSHGICPNCLAANTEPDDATT